MFRKRAKASASPQAATWAVTVYVPARGLRISCASKAELPAAIWPGVEEPVRS